MHYLAPGCTKTYDRQYSTRAELLNRNGHATIDAAYFDRQQVSAHYLHRTGRSVRTIQTTFLVDTAEEAIIDLHCSTKWPSEMRIGPKIARVPQATFDAPSPTKGTMT